MRGRKGISLQATTISILIFSFFVVSFMTIASDVGDDYDQTMTFNNGNLTDSLKNSTNRVKDLSEDIANNTRSADATATENIVTFVSSGVSSLQIIYESMNIITDMTNVVAQEIGIPATAVTFFLVVVTLTITFAIIAALLKTGGSV